jgi:hypothetical protein
VFEGSGEGFEGRRALMEAEMALIEEKRALEESKATRIKTEMALKLAQVIKTNLGRW